VEVGVAAAASQEVVVGAALDDAAVLDDEDLVGGADGRRMLFDIPRVRVDRCQPAADSPPR
jgi:hypothetical protein